MKAQVLNISVPYNGCDKHCPYCVSNMTGIPQKEPFALAIMLLKWRKVVKFAEKAGVESILLSGKGEPLLNKDAVFTILNWFKDFPCELQTNGRFLNSNQDVVTKLRQEGLDIVAISVDTLAEIKSYTELIRNINANNMITRVCLNVSSILTKEINYLQKNTIEYWEYLAEHLNKVGVRQLLVRNITIPKNTVSTPLSDQTKEWVTNNTSTNLFNSLYTAMRCKGRQIRKTIYNIPIFDYNGVSVLFSDYCIEENNEDIMRSLVFHEDGHVYTLWNSKASILF